MYRETKRRKITGEDIYLKARMLAEGVKIQVIQPPPSMRMGMTLHEFLEAPTRACGPDFDWSDSEKLLNKLNDEGMGVSWALFSDVVIFEGSHLYAPIISNDDSRLVMEVNGFDVVIKEDGRELVQGRIDSEIGNRPWSGKMLSGGHKIETFLPGLSESIVNVFLNVSCHNYNTDRICKYCGLFSSTNNKKNEVMPIQALKPYMQHTAEAVKIITDNGWMGTVGITGGALPPTHQHEVLDRVEIILTALREALDEQTFTDLNYVFNHYPPKNLHDLDKLKALGVNGTGLDLETATAEKFAEICPGKHAYMPYQYWLEAQEASAQVFGRYAHTSTFVLVGIESADDLCQRISERFDKGMLVAPVVFLPDPNSQMAEYKIPGGAEWLVETHERLADLYHDRMFKNLSIYLRFTAILLKDSPHYWYNRFVPGSLKTSGGNVSRPFASWPMRYHAALIQDEAHKRFQRKYPGYFQFIQPLVDYATSNTQKRYRPYIRPFIEVA